MPITPEQREARQHHIGGSDLAAIMGIDPYMTAEQVRLEKLARLEPAPPSKAMSLGTWLENGVLDYAEESLGALNRNVEIAVAALPIVVVHADAVVRDSGRPVEAKTSGIKRGYVPGEEWGSEGSDEVPESVIVQCQGHMAATGADLCHVPALLGGRGLTMYAVRLDEAMVQMILDTVARFWDFNVRGDHPCPDVPPLDVLRRVRRRPNKVVTFDVGGSEAVQAWLEAAKAATDARKDAEAAQAAVLALLGDAEAAELPDGTAVVYAEQKQTGYTVEDTRYRVLRHKKKGL